MGVIVYSAEGCGWCEKTKEFLKENKIKFTEKDVSKGKNGEEMVKKSGQTGTPVVDINGKIIVGFNEDKMKELLKL